MTQYYTSAKTMDKNDLEALESGEETRAKGTLQKFVEKVCTVCLWSALIKL